MKYTKRSQMSEEIAAVSKIEKRNSWAFEGNPGAIRPANVKKPSHSRPHLPPDRAVSKSTFRKGAKLPNEAK
jgi:hypothetical protein